MGLIPRAPHARVWVDDRSTHSAVPAPCVASAMSCTPHTFIHDRRRRSFLNTDEIGPTTQYWPLSRKIRVPPVPRVASRSGSGSGSVTSISNSWVIFTILAPLQWTPTVHAYSFYNSTASDKRRPVFELKPEAKNRVRSMRG